MGISVSGFQRPRQVQSPSQASTTSLTLVTALSITGIGRLIQVSTLGGTNPSTLKITIDGVVIFNATGTAAGTTYYPLTTKNSGGTTIFTSTPINIDLNFKKSVLIEHCMTGSGTAYTAWSYEIE